MAKLHEAKFLSRTSAVLEKEAKVILEEQVRKQGILAVQGGDYMLNITEKPRAVFDTKALKAAHPELVSTFTKTSTSVYYEVESLGGVNEE